MTDPIADMLTRIRNANTAKHDTVDVPASKMKISIAEILLKEGYIKSFELVDNGNFKDIRITLKYGKDKNEKIISGLKRISKPGLRVYASSENVPKVFGGLGTAIVGLLLDFSGFKGTLTVQPDSAINMLHIMYLIVPFALDLIITFILSKMNVEKANAEIKEKLGISENEVVMESQN